MSELPSESTEEQSGPPRPSDSARPAGEPMPPVEPPAHQGPFDSLFEELGDPQRRSNSSHSDNWHAAWESQHPVDPPASRLPLAGGSAIPRPDDSPFATIALPPPAEIPYAPPVYETPAPAQRRSVLRPAGRLVRELAETVVLALAIFLLVRAVVQNFQVEGRSMEPTLETGWYLLVNKSLYWEINLNTVGKLVPFVDGGKNPTRYIFRGPKRGDVIVFRDPNQQIGAPERDFIKRVIGLPGEVIEVHNGTVFINGKPLHEPYIADKPNYDCPAKRVPQGTYFVLGDNRNNSSDSHAWGTVPKGNIIGQAWLIYWPFHQFGLVNNKHAQPDASQPESNFPAKQQVPLITRAGCTIG